MTIANMIWVNITSFARVDYDRLWYPLLFNIVLVPVHGYSLFLDFRRSVEERKKEDME